MDGKINDEIIGKKCLIVNHFWPENLHALPKLALRFVELCGKDEWIILSNRDKDHTRKIIYLGVPIIYCNLSEIDFSSFKEVVFCGSLIGSIYYIKKINNKNKSAIITSKKYSFYELFSIKFYDLFLSLELTRKFMINLIVKIIPDFFLRNAMRDYQTIYVPGRYFLNSFKKYFKNDQRIIQLPKIWYNCKIKKDLKIKKDRFQILFVGHSYVTRGADLLCDAFRQIMEDKKSFDAEINFLINPMFGHRYNKGHTNELKYIIKKLKENKKYKNFKFKIGYSKNLDKYYRKANVLVYVYRYLPDILAYPLVILEAKSYGCRIITSNFKNNLEVTDKEDYLIKPKSVRELKMALLTEYNKFKGERNGI